MFTGLVEELGKVKALRGGEGALRLTISAVTVMSELSVDDSISVNGVCLTIVDRTACDFEVQAVPETLRKTTIGHLKPGSLVNLERALQLSGRMGGHIVQGHVDSIGRVVAVQAQQGGLLATVEVPNSALRYIIDEGSIAIDGVSLTVARKVGRRLTIALIPHTLEATSLREISVGVRVNVEVDVIGKYVENLLMCSQESKLTAHWQKQFDS